MKKLMIFACCLSMALWACKRDVEEPSSNANDDPKENKEEKKDESGQDDPKKEEQTDPDTFDYSWTPDPNDIYTSNIPDQISVNPSSNPSSVSVSENTNSQSRAALLDMTGYQDPSYQKRGTCFNSLPDAVGNELSKGALRWGYNWTIKSSASTIGKGKAINYYPMQWGNFTSTTDLENQLKNTHPDILLGFNEPMMTSKDGGCTMTPKRAAELWPQLERLAKTYNVKLASPALTYGYQKVDGVVYSSPEAWMDKFIYEYKKLYNNRVPRYDYLVLHSYMNWPGAVADYVSKYAKRYNVKVMLTEFCAWEQGSDPWNNINNLEKEKFPDYSFQQASMTQKVEAMDQNPNVAGYAWFNSPGSTNSIPWNGFYSNNAPTQLSRVYAFMSTNNTNKYYSDNVFIPAPQYVTSSNYNKSKTDAFASDYRIIFGESTDDEFKSTLPIEIRRFKESCFLNYLISVPSNGTYTITLRYYSTESTSITATCGNTSVKADMKSTNGKWVDRSFEMTLTAGNHAFQLASSGKGTDVRLSCWMFKKK